MSTIEFVQSTLKVGRRLILATYQLLYPQLSSLHQQILDQHTNAGKELIMYPMLSKNQVDPLKIWKVRSRTWKIWFKHFNRKSNNTKLIFWPSRKSLTNKHFLPNVCNIFCPSSDVILTYTLDFQITTFEALYDYLCPAFERLKYIGSHNSAKADARQPKCGRKRARALSPETTIFSSFKT